MGKKPPKSVALTSPDLEALGMSVQGLVREDGTPATAEDLAAADAAADARRQQAQITITLDNPEALLDAFGSVFGYRSEVRDILNPGALIPNPMSPSDFVVAILREYIARVQALAAKEGSRP